MVSPVVVSEAPTIQVVEQAPQPASISEAEAKAKVYHHESGNNPAAINKGSGACGIGQALPCSKLPCTLQDYACQDNWFTNYMQQRYGSWAAAWEYWNCTGNCTNKYGTVYKSTTWW